MVVIPAKAGIQVFRADLEPREAARPVSLPYPSPFPLPKGEGLIQFPAKIF